jgi:hypothetical protein
MPLDIVKLYPEIVRLANLFSVLELSSKRESLAHIQDKIKWLFHSKTLALGKEAPKAFGQK